MKKAYLGDGLYAEFNGRDFVLTHEIIGQEKVEMLFTQKALNAFDMYVRAVAIWARNGAKKYEGEESV